VGDKTTMPSSWSVYMVRCVDNSLYTGITTDIKRRLREHNNELTSGARYTRARRPVELVYHEPVKNRRVASQREVELKSWSKQAKEDLVATQRASKGKNRP